MLNTDCLSAHDWLVRLGVRTAATMPAAEARAKLAEYLPDLVRQFPADAFCERSLSAVTYDLTFFPAFAEVRKRLAEWWNDNKSSFRPPIEDVSKADWLQEDHQWLAYWYKRQAEGFAKLPDAVRGGSEHVLSLIASRSAKAAKYIRSEYRQ